MCFIREALRVLRSEYQPEPHSDKHKELCETLTHAGKNIIVTQNMHTFLQASGMSKVVTLKKISA